MEWKKRRKAKLVSVLLILILLIVNSVSYVMADEYTIPTSKLSEETETQDQDIVLANSISGVLWLDENGDGILDEEEDPISDYPVYLYSNGDLSAEVQKVITDQEGKYEFSELEPGDYIVGVKAGENETEYFLPEEKVTDDTTNKFTADAELITVAYSEIITIAEDSIVTDISCGMGLTAALDAEQTESGNADANNVINNADGTSDTSDNELQNEDSAEEEQETDSEQSLDYSISPSDLETDTGTTDTNGANGGLRTTTGVSPMSISGGYYVYSGETYTGASYLLQCDTLYQACDFINGSADGTYTISVADDDTDVGTTGTINSGKIVYLRSNGTIVHTLTQKTALTRHLIINGTLYLQDITLDGNESGGGLSVRNGKLVMKDRSTIQKCYTYVSSSSVESAGVYIYNSVIEMYDGALIDSNATGCATSYAAAGGGLSVKYTSTFNMYGGKISNNTASSAGGGVYIADSSTGTIGGKSEITNNTGARGGGINVGQRCSLAIEGDTSIDGNKATANGGGIYCNINSNLAFSGGCITNNEADGRGGGICSSGGFSMTDGEISGNTAYQGGGLGNEYSGGTFIMSDGLITNNNATWGGGVAMDFTTGFTMTGGEIYKNTATSLGGGVFMLGENTTFEMTTISCYIRSNTAPTGGGVYLNSGIFNMKAGTIGGSGYANTATSGGGVYVRGSGGTFNMGGISSCYIHYNEATDGGGVLISGGMSSDAGVFNMTTTDCYIRKNEATSSGGGVYVAFGAFNMKAGHVGDEGYGNTAANGGGVYAASGGTITMGGNGDCYIQYNTSSSSGGGVYLYTYNPSTSSNVSALYMTTTSCYIRSNTATVNGGGVYISGGTLDMQAGTIGGSGYTNTAANGGGVYISLGTLLMASSDSNITYNKASSGNGGGVYLSTNGNITTSGGSITNNSAASGNGGGIYTADTPSYSNIKTDSSTVFSGNSAQRYCNPPTHADTDYPNIGYRSVSFTSAEIESEHPLNNYDINCETVKLTYDPNSTYGGQGTAYYEYYVKNTDALIVDNTDDKLGYTNSNSLYYFDGWNGTINGNGESYTVGTAYTLSVDTTLYAQWKTDTGSVTIEKYSNSTTPLPGAEFTIEQWNGTSWEYITYDALTGTWSASSTAGEFKLTTEMDSEEKIASLTFANLPLGKYRLTEVKAPAGYALLAKQIEVEIPYYDGSAYYYDLTYTVSDVAVIDLPDAGSGLVMRTIVLTGAFIALLSAAAYIYLRKRRSKSATLQS